MVQSKEDWVLWASTAALRAQREEASRAEGAAMRGLADQLLILKQLADSIHLTADGVVPLDLTCPSSREALLGSAGVAYTCSAAEALWWRPMGRSGGMGVWGQRW